jgi:HlyD family secretion protein
MELTMKMLFIAGILSITACNSVEESDAFGQFEAEEVTISAEANGKLLTFSIEEGERLQAGQRVGKIDTVSLVLKRNELVAMKATIQSSLSQLEAQAEVYRSQKATARKTYERLLELQKDEAATQQQLDDIEGTLNTLEKQIDAVIAQKNAVFAEMNTMQVRIEQIKERLQKTTIFNPIEGVVLSTFAQPMELMAEGRALYEIADTEALLLRVYVSGAQLPDVVLGQEVEVWVDENEKENRSLSGRVSWISSKAEFTPQMIQTKEERVSQMYAVKIVVQNPDGRLKIGMPGEVNF